MNKAVQPKREKTEREKFFSLVIGRSQTLCRPVPQQIYKLVRTSAGAAATPAQQDWSFHCFVHS